MLKVRACGQRVVKLVHHTSHLVKSTPKHSGNKAPVHRGPRRGLRGGVRRAFARQDRPNAEVRLELFHEHTKVP